MQMRTLKVGDLVIHCRDGLAEISGQTKINDRDFFLVHIHRDSNETTYVPVVGAENIIRPIMTVEEANSIIELMNAISLEYNKNTKQRRDLFKKKLASGNVKEIAYLFRQYYLFKTHPDEVKIGPVDIDMLSFATNNLLDEFSLTYNIPRDQIQEYIYKQMK